MSTLEKRGSPVLEWTRMSSRNSSPYFLPKPTPGYSSAYNTEKPRKTIPSVNLDKSIGRDASGNLSDPDSKIQKDHHKIVTQYGLSEAEIEERKKAEQHKRFMLEGQQYVKAEGKTHKVLGGPLIGKITGRNTPVFWEPSPTPDERETVELNCDSPSKGFTMNKAPRFKEIREAVAKEASVRRNRALDVTQTVLTSKNLLKRDVGTFGRSPARPTLKEENQQDLSVNYEYVKGQLTRSINLGKYASREPGPEEKPSTKFKQLFKRLQRPYVPLTDRLRSTQGMSTMISSSRGDLGSILRHADNDRLRALSSLAMNETSPQIKEILYPQDSEDGDINM